ISRSETSEPSCKGISYSASAPRTDDSWAARLRGFGPAGIVTMLVIPFAGTALLSAILVLLWAWYTRTPWRELGYVRPKSWISASIVGIAFGVAFKLVMKAFVMPLLGAVPINQTYHYLAGDRAAALEFGVFILIGAGFGEETLYRGFLFERFGKLLGP